LGIRGDEENPALGIRGDEGNPGPAGAPGIGEGARDRGAAIGWPSRTCPRGYTD
jgi:hypothetical protein